MMNIDAFSQLGLREFYEDIERFKGIPCRHMKFMSADQKIKMGVDISGISTEDNKGEFCFKSH